MTKSAEKRRLFHVSMASGADIVIDVDPCSLKLSDVVDCYEYVGRGVFEEDLTRYRVKCKTCVNPNMIQWFTWFDAEVIA